MTINIRWQNDNKTVLLQTYEGLWTLAEFQHATETVFGMLNEINHPADVIVDLTESTTLTADLLSYAEREHGLENVRVHNNQRRVVVVGASMLLQTIMKYAQNKMAWMNDEAEYADTVDEANLILSDQRAPSVFRFNRGHTRPLQSVNAR